MASSTSSATTASTTTVIQKTETKQKKPEVGLQRNIYYFYMNDSVLLKLYKRPRLSKTLELF